MARKCIGFQRAAEGKMPHQRIFNIPEAVRGGHDKEMLKVLSSFLATSGTMPSTVAILQIIEASMDVKNRMHCMLYFIYRVFMFSWLRLRYCGPQTVWSCRVNNLVFLLHFKNV